MFSRLDRDIRLKSEIQDLIDKSIEQSKREVEKGSEITTKQKILILYYTGVLKKLDIDNSKKSKLLSKILSKHEQNIREILTYIDSSSHEQAEIKTKGNLLAVRLIFEKLEMSKEIALIDKDLKLIN